MLRLITVSRAPTARARTCTALVLPLPVSPTSSAGSPMATHAAMRSSSCRPWRVGAKLRGSTAAAAPPEAAPRCASPKMDSCTWPTRRPPDEPRDAGGRAVTSGLCARTRWSATSSLSPHTAASPRPSATRSAACGRCPPKMAMASATIVSLERSGRNTCAAAPAPPPGSTATLWASARSATSVSASIRCAHLSKSLGDRLRPNCASERTVAGSSC